MPSDYDKIADAISYISENHTRQPGLEEIASSVGLSEAHFQRLFTRWAGISPKRLVQYLTASQAGELLRRRISTFETSMEVGLSSNSRLHELFIALHGMTPAEYASHADQMHISWGYCDSPFGSALIGTTEKGICWLSFQDRENSGEQQMRAEWKGARFTRDDDRIVALMAPVFSIPHQGKSVSVLVKGTNFQIRVWEALLKIPMGTTTTYGDISKHLGNPRASRAVGTAIGANPVSWLIPCHRVIQSTGLVGGYRWGTSTKRMILTREAVLGEYSVAISS